MILGEAAVYVELLPSDVTFKVMFVLKAAAAVTAAADTHTVGLLEVFPNQPPPTLSSVMLCDVWKWSFSTIVLPNGLQLILIITHTHTHTYTTCNAHIHPDTLPHPQPPLLS